jgi:preprotein translocase subunit SecG
MLAVLLVIHLIVAVSIIVIVLLQPSETGGFMGNSGSMSNLGAPRRSADVLSRTTTVLAGCFFLTSLLLAIAAGHRPKQDSILDDASAATPAAVTAPAVAADKPAEPAKPAKADEKPAAPKAPLAQ